MSVSTNAENSLDFSNLSLKLNNSDDVEFIRKDIMSKISVETLNLSGNTLGIDAAEVIGSALCNCTKLTRCLLHDLFTGRSKLEIAPALMHLSTGIMTSGCQLVELNLSDNAFGPNGVVGVTELLASPTCYTLKILRMDNEGLGHEGCRHLSQALEKGFKESGGRGLRLKVFSAGRNRLENVGVQLLSDVFSEMGSLEEMLRKNTSLRVLNLSDNSLTPKGGEALSGILRSLTVLEELYLNDCILRSVGTCALARAFDDPETVPTLRVLHVTGNEIKRDAGISLVLSLAQKSDLKSLDLNTNEFGPSGIRALIQVVDSVGLRHALPSPSAGGDEGEPVGEDQWLQAFDDDQGSNSGSEDGEEEEEDEELEGEEEEHDGKAWEDSETYEEEQYEYEQVTDEEPADNREVEKDQKVNFSFRELEKQLVGGCNVRADALRSPPSADNGQGERRNPFASKGLFSTPSPRPNDTTDAASLRAKMLTQPTSLFANSPSVPGGRVGHIFSPPFLSQLTTTAAAAAKTTPTVTPSSATKSAISSTNLSTPSSAMTNNFQFGLSSNLSTLESQLTRYLSCNTVGDSVVKELAAFLRMNTSGLPSLTVGRLSQLSRGVSPEQVVRLSLLLADHEAVTSAGKQGAQCDDTLGRFAVDLLASVLTGSGVVGKDVSNGDQSGGHSPSSRTSRAVNCLLVHLQAIKAERGSPDDLTKRPAEEQQRHLVACLSLTRRLLTVYTASELPPEIRDCLTLCLSEQRQKQALEPKKPSPGDGESGLLRDELLALLIGGMTNLRLSTAT